MTVDYEEGLKHFAGKETLYRKYLGKYKEDKNFEGCKEAYAAADMDAMLARSHALKGISSTLGLMEVYEASDDIVKAIRANDTEDMHQKYERLLKANADAEIEIRKILGSE